MKKITLLFLLVTLCFAYNVNAQDNCGSALAVTSGVTNTTTINNDGILDAEMSASGGSFDAAWYTFTAPSAGTIDISSCLGGSDTVLFVGSGTCGSLTTLADSDDDCDDGSGSILAASISDLDVIGGTTYYIEWGDVWDVTPFDWTLTFTPAASCEVPTNLVQDFITDVQIDFSWSVPVAGTPVDYNWEIQPDGVAQGTPGALAAGTTPALSDSSGPVLTAGTDYVLYIQTNCGGGDTSAYINGTFTTNLVPPPSNDNCASAEVITVNSAPATFTNEGSSVEVGEPFGSCWFFEEDDLDESVWFSFTIPVVDDVTVSLDFVGGTLMDTALTVYSGSCGSLTQVDCDDDGGAGGLSTANINGLAAGTYLVQVDGALSDEGSFDIEIAAPNTLSLDSVESNTAFTYFPNPVKNTLQLNAQNTINNVSIYNVIGQEVIRVTPNTLESEIDMSALRTGTYFVNVTVGNITKTVRIIKQ
ncbi:T9SS type A sorting domain-containing protein [Winogradskyella sp.]|uniref:T9SS type A sorting domain-containing protein n=1 Tax=Winogradskyella sp. TaxID=1883156 RepID=UPI003F6B9A60